MEYCSLSEYASFYGYTLRTAYNHYSKGRLKGAYKDPVSKRVKVPIEYIKTIKHPNVVIYATVSPSDKDKKKAMDAEVEYIKRYCKAKAYTVIGIVKEMSSTIIEERPKLMRLLKDRHIKHIIVANRNAISRFSFDYIDALMKCDGREIEYVDNKDAELDVVKKDFTDVVYSLCTHFSAKDITYEDVRKALVSLGVAERKNAIRPDRKRAKQPINKKIGEEDL